MRICAYCGKPFAKKRSTHYYCTRKCSSMDWYIKSQQKVLRKHHRAEVKTQKLEDERIKIQIMGFRLIKTGSNSSPDAMRELAGLKPIEIKQASTFSELIMCKNLR